MPVVRTFARFVRQQICSVLHVFGAEPMQTQPSNRAVRLEYEPEYDLLYVWVGPSEPADTVEVEPGVCVRLSRQDHRVIGLEILSAARRFNKDQRTVQTPAFAQSLLDRYGPLAALQTA